MPLLRLEAERNRAAEGQLEVEVREGHQGGHQAASPQDLQERIEELEATMVKVHSGAHLGPAHLSCILSWSVCRSHSSIIIGALKWSESCCGLSYCLADACRCRTCCLFTLIAWRMSRRHFHIHMLLRCIIHSKTPSSLHNGLRNTSCRSKFNTVVQLKTDQ